MIKTGASSDTTFSVKPGQDPNTRRHRTEPCRRITLNQDLVHGPAHVVLGTSGVIEEYLSPGSAYWMFEGSYLALRMVFLNKQLSTSSSPIEESQADRKSQIAETRNLGLSKETIFGQNPSSGCGQPMEV
jgi:hypothetical protein